MSFYITTILMLSSLSILSSFFPNALEENQSIDLQERWEAPAWTDTLQNLYADHPDVVKKGMELYELYCWNCHGESGKGDGPAGATLEIPPANFRDKQVRKQKDGAIFWKITNGRGDMISYEELLSEEQRWQLVSYIRKLSK